MVQNVVNIIRTRQDIWALSKQDKWHPTLLWYAKAVADMLNRPLADPTSWRYQAAIHGYSPLSDPFLGKNEQPPSGWNATPGWSSIWSQCQHSTWYFLPWHRMYLYYFELIVADTIGKLGGPSDWALPYWNYSDSSNPDAMKIPPAFLEAKLPDGTLNPLNMAKRSSHIDPMGNIADLTKESVSVEGCLKERVFSAPIGSSSFGGKSTAFNHSGGTAAGSLEQTPHNDIHVFVGGDEGWMYDPDLAALDPIFWIHHANIDRLWEVWRNRTPNNVNPADNNWQKPLHSFNLSDQNGKSISFKPSQTQDIAALNYRYDNISDPLSGFKTGVEKETFIMTTGLEIIPELVGATEEPHLLSHETTSTSFTLVQPSGPAALSARAIGKTRHIYLNIENVVGRSPGAHTYAIHLNIPDTKTTREHLEKHRDYFVGTMALFGLKQASSNDGSHSGNGLTFVYDVTEVIENLKTLGKWNTKNIHVSFIPLRQHNRHPEIQVGRISLYYGD